MKNTGLLIGILVVLVLGRTLLTSYNKNKQPSEPTSVMPIENSKDTTEKMVASDAKEIVVEGAEFLFKPNVITVKKGEKVRIILKNTGKMPHDFVIDELGVKTKTIRSGETDTVEFTPDKIGNFEFYCSVGNHRAMGMKGSFTVQ